MTIMEALKNTLVLLESMNVPGTETEKHAAAKKNVKNVILALEEAANQPEQKEEDKHED